ncbi:MAG: hypothetical protein MMC23_006556 [Stictis urceolatum]|nr:hypothetical protein [Stictis urceolata]
MERLTLLSLPNEVLSNILRCPLPRTETIPEIKAKAGYDQVWHNNEVGRSTAMMRTCSRLYHLGMPVLYGENEFHLHIHASRVVFEPVVHAGYKCTEEMGKRRQRLYLRQWFCAKPWLDRALPYLHRVHITIREHISDNTWGLNDSRPGWYGGDLRTLRELCGRLKCARNPVFVACELQRWYWEGYWNRPIEDIQR